MRNVGTWTQLRSEAECCDLGTERRMPYKPSWRGNGAQRSTETNVALGKKGAEWSNQRGSETTKAKLRNVATAGQ